MIMKDFANADGLKIKRIMKGGDCQYWQYPKGVIKTGKENTKC